MSIIRILQYPDPKLRRKGIKVTDFGEATQQTIDNMFETHYASTNCAALAATQLDIPNAPHITVIDFSEEKNQPLCLVNGVIVSRSGTQSEEEGCMSVGPSSSTFAKVIRAQKIHVKAYNRHGEEMELDAEGFMAKCIQHELDHLDGKLFIDHLSPLKRKRLEAALKKQKRIQKSKEESS